MTTRGTPLKYPKKRRFGNKNVLGKRWSAKVPEKEVKRRIEMLARVRHTQPALGKRWKHSEETKLMYKRIALERFKNGATVHPKSGFGKVGFREDLGHFVRSTWEANMCRIFKFLGVEYVYEPYRILVGDSTYLPDFWVSDLRCYIEVKGWDDPKRSWKPLAATRQGYPTVVIGPDRYKYLEQKYRERIPNWEE